MQVPPHLLAQPILWTGYVGQTTAAQHQSSSLSWALSPQPFSPQPFSSDPLSPRNVGTVVLVSFDTAAYAAASTCFGAARLLLFTYCVVKVDCATDDATLTSAESSPHVPADLVREHDGLFSSTPVHSILHPWPMVSSTPARPALFKHDFAKKCAP